jgi:hypothetical protein
MEPGGNVLLRLSTDNRTSAEQWVEALEAAGMHYGANGMGRKGSRWAWWRWRGCAHAGMPAGRGAFGGGRQGGCVTSAGSLTMRVQL